MLSILHISDLHRSPNEPVDNDAVVAALIADRDRYVLETPAIPAPTAIIVSGDIIQGERLGAENWEEKIREQYLVAEDFLDHLCRRMVDGDRSRLILVPGNHDVCWNTSRNAMTEISESEYPSDVRRILLAPDSPYRWDWKERSLLKIMDNATYATRLRFYWEFVERFYDGVCLLQPIDPLRGYQLYELPESNAVIAAFESTEGNDCFSYAGAIKRGAVARCSLALRDLDRAFDLQIAVWHHSIQGPPARDDYMDVEQVYEMIGLGIQLGVHGHQHAAQTSTHYVHLSGEEAMAVVSAGSLCAGSSELPRGVNRQYNVIAVDDSLRKARVHLREMVEGEHFTRRARGGFDQGFSDLEWQPRKDRYGRPVIAQMENDRRAVLEAERQLRSGVPRRAIDLLANVPTPPGTHARMIASEACVAAQDWVRLGEILSEPSTPTEVTYAFAGMLKLGDADGAEKLVKKSDRISASVKEELLARVAMTRMMRG